MAEISAGAGRGYVRRARRGRALAAAALIAAGAAALAGGWQSGREPGGAPALPGGADASAGQASDAPAAAAIEQEVLANVLQQPVGRDTLVAYQLPPEFLTRVVDRIIRSSFEARHRVVVEDVAGAPGSEAPVGAGPQAAHSDQQTTESGDAGRRTRLILIGSITAAAAVATIVMMLVGRRKKP